MSDLSSTSGQPALKAQQHANPAVLMPVLWLAAAIAIAWPSIDGGVFDAMATDDAMRLVQVRDLIERHGLVQNLFSIDWIRPAPRCTGRASSTCRWLR